MLKPPLAPRFSVPRFLLAGAALLSLGSGAFAQAAKEHQHAHVHGVATLGIAVQDKTLTIALESPLDSVLGFEHRPTTPAQQAAVDALRARMRAPGNLFKPDAAAACELTKSEAESALFQPAPSGAAASEHADLDATFEYTCAHPDKLALLDVGLFEAYPRLQKLDVSIATAQGQAKRELKRPQRSVALGR